MEDEALGAVDPSMGAAPRIAISVRKAADVYAEIRSDPDLLFVGDSRPRRTCSQIGEESTRASVVQALAVRSTLSAGSPGRRSPLWAPQLRPALELAVVGTRPLRPPGADDHLAFMALAACELMRRPGQARAGATGDMRWADDLTPTGAREDQVEALGEPT